MPNGHGRNLSRLMRALKGFRGLHGHWPKRVRLEQCYIDDFQNLLTETGYQQLISKMSLVPGLLDGMRAEDDQGNSFTFGIDPMTDISREINVAEWLGEPEMKPYDGD